MKNRVILNGQGIPVVPPPDVKMGAEVALSDAKAQFKKGMAEAFKMGFSGACECMEVSFERAMNAGHTELKLEDGIRLVKELRLIADAQAKKLYF